MDLTIDYDATRKVGNGILEKGDDFKALLDKIEEENNTLKAYYQGADATAYLNAVDAEIGSMRSLNDSIYEMGNFVIDAVNAFERVNEANQSGIK